ncbi:MAG: menaquinone-dependent protoporphyrinogen oxidase [Solirubrobacteraceae bacterium]|jgi:menaquinone-dependent protoporphyrinogen oxidase|nr:menaquinone-dependent protoporphyrinogen oxidase [Solirubrobacteraceae bacterium]
MRYALPPSSNAAWGGVLLVYFSTHGHTATVAMRIAEGLRAEGLVVDLRDVADAGDVDPVRHDVVVVGASLHREPDRDEIVGWVMTHRLALADRPTALFSVALSDSGRGDESQAALQRSLRDFMAQTGWSPDRSVAFSGALEHQHDDRGRDPVERFADELALLAAVPAAA